VLLISRDCQCRRSMGAPASLRASRQAVYTPARRTQHVACHSRARRQRLPIPTYQRIPACRSRHHPRVVRLRLFRRHSTTASMPTLAFAASAHDVRPRFVRRDSPRARESRPHHQLRARGPSVLVHSASTPRSYPFSRPGTCEPPPLIHRQAVVGRGICVGADITTSGRDLVTLRRREPAR
jgi:hypothetical protein